MTSPRPAVVTRGHGQMLRSPEPATIDVDEKRERCASKARPSGPATWISLDGTTDA